MSEQKIEDFIGKVLIGDAKKNALDFVAYLRVNGMLFERGVGYWEDKFYWFIKYKDKSVCYILIGSPEEELSPWTVWSDDSDSIWFETLSLEEHIKEIAWKYVDFCGSCGGDCSPGKHKTIFGKEFDNVCRATMRFTNPDNEALECMKKIVEIRKLDILKNI